MRGCATEAVELAEAFTKWSIVAEEQALAARGVPAAERAKVGGRGRPPQTELARAKHTGYTEKATKGTSIADAGVDYWHKVETLITMVIEERKREEGGEAPTNKRAVIAQLATTTSATQVTRKKKRKEKRTREGAKRKRRSRRWE